MKIAVFYYDGFVEFEIVLACLILKDHEIIFTGLEDKIYISEEKQKYHIDLKLEDIDLSSLDGLIIPGGDPSPLFDNTILKYTLIKLSDAKKKIAGICGGSVLLAKMGILDGKICTGNTNGIREGNEDFKYFSKAELVDKYVVVDGNIITAQGQAFIEFCSELARQFGEISTEKEFKDLMNWFMNKRVENK